MNLAYYDRIINTLNFAFRALNVIHQNGLNKYENIRAVIQTNGIVFSILNIDQTAKIREFLKNLLNLLEKGKIIFEISFKSPNNHALLNKQLLGFNVLKQILVPLWNESLDNIAIYPIAGLGPSIDFDNLWIIPIDPSSLPQEIPLFHQSTWLPRFKTTIMNFIEQIVPNYNAYMDFRRNPKSNNGTKIAIEGLEPTPFQTSWISGYAGSYNENDVKILSINKLLRKLTLDRPNDPKWARWYNSWLSSKLFSKSERWLDVLKQIPASNDPNNLLAMVHQMDGFFYSSHPIGHYPSL